MNPIKKIGKKFEKLARKIRANLHPSYRKTYKDLCEMGMGQYTQNLPKVLFDFRSQDIDAVAGRYVYSMILDFIAAGYFPVFLAHRATLSTFRHSTFKKLLMSHPFGVVTERDTYDDYAAVLSDNRVAPKNYAGLWVSVNYTWRIASQPHEIAFPFFIHPEIEHLNDLSWSAQANEKRAIRLFFAGNTDQGKYDSEDLKRNYGVLTRREMLEVAEKACHDNQIIRPQNSSEVFDTQLDGKFVWCETQRCKIPIHQWMHVLAKSDFFLACPGVGMPLCHNVIEALRTGCIPVIEYDQYLNPPLQNGVNCLSFRGKEELNALIKKIMVMPVSEILNLRNGVLDYAAKHLQTGAWANQLMTSSHRKQITLLMNSYRVAR